MKKLLILSTIALAALTSACGQAGFNASGSNQDQSVVAANYLNALPRSGSLHVHFDQVSLAKLIEIAIMLGAPCYLDPATNQSVCPQGGIFKSIQIGGSGYISPSPLPPAPGPAPVPLSASSGSVASIPELDVLVSYDPSIDIDPVTKVSCLAEAEKALANHLTLDIFGDSKIWPVPQPIPCPPNAMCAVPLAGGASAGSGGLQTDGSFSPIPTSSSTIQGPGIPNPLPPFKTNQVGITLGSIASCLAH